MAGRRARVAAALAVAALLGAAAAWRAKAGPAPAPAASSGPLPKPTHEARASGRDLRRRAPPALPASAFEPTIDLPAGPPPEQGAGDDLEESGLPRALFEAKIRLERLSPTPARLEAAEAHLGHAIPEAAREQLSASFRRHDEAAAAAIGYFRLREVSEEEAAALIARELAGYRRDAAAALGVPGEEAERLLAEAGSPR
jgi:hypothetical protein